MTGEISKKNIILHEFIGLHATIIETPCKNLQNVSGRIIDETMNTFKIEYLISGKPKCVIVPKHKTKFRFVVPVNENTLEVSVRPIHIDIDGTILTKRPEDRIKKLAKLANKKFKRDHAN